MMAGYKVQNLRPHQLCSSPPLLEQVFHLQRCNCQCSSSSLAVRALIDWCGATIAQPITNFHLHEMYSTVRDMHAEQNKTNTKYINHQHSGCGVIVPGPEETEEGISC